MFGWQMFRTGEVRNLNLWFEEAEAGRSNLFKCGRYASLSLLETGGGRHPLGVGKQGLFASFSAFGCFRKVEFILAFSCRLR